MNSFVVVAVGSHMIELIKRNDTDVVAIIDYRASGSFSKAIFEPLSNNIHRLGAEEQFPLISIFSNIRYYKKLGSILDQYPNCKVIISGNHAPIFRFIIDYVGVERIELWEDGLGHYLQAEDVSLKSNIIYNLKSVAKLLAGFYPKNIFDNHYQSEKLIIKDRFIHTNLEYERTYVQGNDCYYIGQPLIEDNFLSERTLKEKLKLYFGAKRAFYLPHPREKKREWLNEIFTVLEIDSTAEEYIIKHGAEEIYSAFSTVNMNLQCNTNVYISKYLGLTAIDEKLRECNFGIVCI